jgi:hypothetical protein
MPHALFPDKAQPSALFEDDTLSLDFASAIAPAAATIVSTYLNAAGSLARETVGSEPIDLGNRADLQDTLGTIVEVLRDIRLRLEASKTKSLSSIAGEISEAATNLSARLHRYKIRLSPIKSRFEAQTSATLFRNELRERHGEPSFDEMLMLLCDCTQYFVRPSKKGPPVAEEILLITRLLSSAWEAHTGLFFPIRIDVSAGRGGLPEFQAKSSQFLLEMSRLFYKSVSASEIASAIRKLDPARLKKKRFLEDRRLMPPRKVPTPPADGDR